MTMTFDEINDRITMIRALILDPELAHSEEDKLREEFLEYVATLSHPLAKKAALILTTRQIEFPRWYA